MSFPIKLFAVQKDCLLVGDSSSSGGRRYEFKWGLEIRVQVGVGDMSSSGGVEY